MAIFRGHYSAHRRAHQTLRHEARPVPSSLWCEPHRQALRQLRSKNFSYLLLCLRSFQPLQREPATVFSQIHPWAVPSSALNTVGLTRHAGHLAIDWIQAECPRWEEERSQGLSRILSGLLEPLAPAAGPLWRGASPAFAPCPFPSSPEVAVAPLCR